MNPIDAAFSFLKAAGPMRQLMDNPANPQSELVAGDDEKLQQAYEEAIYLYHPSVLNKIKITDEDEREFQKWLNEYIYSLCDNS